MARINRTDFLQVLQSVQPGLSTNKMYEQSSSFVFRSGRVKTFNDEIACSMLSGLGKDVEGAVDGKKLLEMVNDMSADQLEVTVTGGNLTLTAKNEVAEHKMDAEISLPFESVNKAGEWKPLNDQFTEAVRVVKNCCGKDETKFFVNCVHLHPKWVEARDEFQLCRWPMRTGVSTPTLLRQDSIKHIAALGMTEFSESDSWFHFRNATKLRMSCRRYAEDFPDMAAQLVMEGQKVVFPKGLVEKLGRAKIFSTENETDRVFVQLKPGRVVVIGEGVHGRYTARPKIKYNGPEMSFLIAPDMLAEIIKEHNDCLVTDTRLRVDAGKYKYVTCLARPDDESREEAA